MILTAAVFVTSFLSAVLGMGGCMVLMVVLTLLYSPALAMALHGIIQCLANGQRCFHHRRVLIWPFIRWYFLGMVIPVLPLIWVGYRSDRNTILLAIGTVILLGQFLRWFRSYYGGYWASGAGVTPLKGGHGFLAGAAIIMLHLTAGVSGPLLDGFFQDRPHSPAAIVGTKALTQALSHGVKALYFGAVLATLPAIDGIYLGLALGLSAVGTWLGTLLLHALPPVLFQNLTRLLVISLAGYCLIRGGLGLLGFSV